MHVTSNPFFAFHDDVFPGFAKNAASQPRFPFPSPSFTTIIPDNYRPDKPEQKLFSSLEELKHISTVELKLNGSDKFDFNIDFYEQSFNETKILECQFFYGKTLFSLGTYANGSIWVDSDYFIQRLILKSNVSNLESFGFHLNSKNSSSSSFLKILEE